MMENTHGIKPMLSIELWDDEVAHFERRAEAAGRTLDDQLRYELAVSLGMRLPDPGDREATQRGQFFRRQRTHRPIWG